MKKYLIKLIYILSFLILSVNYVYATQATKAGSADTYKIILERVELCETGSSTTNCKNPVVLGTGAQTIDIASVAAGATAASYGNASLITVGKTYTYVQATLNRKVAIKADFDVSGGSNLFCKTESGNTAGTTSAFAVGTAGTSASSDEAEMVMYIPDEASAHAITGWTLDGDGNSQAGIGISMSSNITGVTSVSGSGTAGDVASSDTYIQHRTALTNAFTMGLFPPKIDISFGTSSAVYSTYSTDKNEDGTANDSACAFWAGEPSVTITLTQ